MVRRRSYKSAIKKFRPFIKGAVAGTVTAAVFTVIGAFLFNIADAPEGADITFGYISLGAASGVCGMFWGGGRGKNGFAWGTLGGVTIFALCFIGAILSGGFSGVEARRDILRLLLCGGRAQADGLVCPAYL